MVHDITDPHVLQAMLRRAQDELSDAKAREKRASEHLKSAAVHEAIAKQEKARADELEHLRALNTAKAAELAAQRQVASRNNGVRVAAAAVSRAQAAAGRAK